MEQNILDHSHAMFTKMFNVHSEER